jgi:tetratricopeptide repeat protein
MAMARRWLLAACLLVVAGCGTKVPQTPLEQAQSSFASGRWEQAVAQCDDLIGQDPDNAAAYLLRGRAHQCAGRLDKALADLTSAIRLNPNDSEAYYQRADVYRALGLVDLKEKDDLAAREHDPLYKASNLEPEDMLAADPRVRIDVPGTHLDDDGVLTDGKAAKPDFGEIGPPPADDLPEFKSIAETLFGPPPGPIDDQQGGRTSSRRKPDIGGLSSSSSGGLGSTTNKKPSTSSSGVGTLPGSKGGGVADGNRAGQLPAAGGVAPEADRPAPGTKRQLSLLGKQLPKVGAGLQVGEADAAPGPADDSRRPNPFDRNLKPYNFSSMRPTGIQDFTPRPEATAGRTTYGRIDPYGGLSGSRSRPGAGDPSANGAPPSSRRATTPTGPYVPQPPGLRYDGGY